MNTQLNEIKTTIEANQEEKNKNFLSDFGFVESVGSVSLLLKDY